MKNKFLFVVKIIINILAGSGVVFFLLPLIFHGYFYIGSLFGESVCIFTLLITNLKKVITRSWKRKRISLLYNIVIGLFVIFIGWLTFLSVKIFSVDLTAPPPNTTVIVLGSRVYEGGPSKSLKARLNTAIDYLNDNNSAKCVVTGGKGEDEPFTEAYGQEQYLLENGIEKNKILLEDKSTSTYENFKYAEKILAENSLPKTVVVSTQKFHLYRAASIAKQLGYTVYCMEAPTEFTMLPDYYGRELMALTKYYLDLL